MQVDRSDKAYKWYVTQPGVMNTTGAASSSTLGVLDQEYLDQRQYAESGRCFRSETAKVFTAENHGAPVSNMEEPE